MLRIFVSAALIFAPLTVFGQSTSETTQVGVANEAAIIQHGMNMARTVQIGSLNSALAVQNGDGNAAVISQVGNGFSKTIVQSGDYNLNASHQVTAPNYNGSFTSYSLSRSNGTSTMTIEFELN